ncbi:unnamed protein product [Adineta steineri]|uniref:MSP domain-containing protein n=1 Tax=Adineta steineri TaxID=433720 RepID=A0A814SZY6_9BILA|nr:unnamed protein product [Adineta steineri]CAF1374601.1 unnamed protein product [Adineta steineri]CAF1605143.1 unnamed protein product [Adineta steineri]
MNWQDEKTTSVYDLSNQENKNSGDTLINYKKSNINCEKFIELRSKPSKSLSFSPSFNSIHLKLYNNNTFPIIFKLKTTQPDIIASQPARGFIQANSFIECHLTPIEIKYDILLVVQYAQILSQYDDYIIQWKNLKSDEIHIKKFQCTFEDKKQIFKKQTLLKPILFTFATITLLTTFVYLRNK